MTSGFRPPAQSQPSCTQPAGNGREARKTTSRHCKQQAAQPARATAHNAAGQSHRRKSPKGQPAEIMKLTIRNTYSEPTHCAGYSEARQFETIPRICSRLVVTRPPFPGFGVGPHPSNRPLNILQISIRRRQLSLSKAQSSEATAAASVQGRTGGQQSHQSSAAAPARDSRSPLFPGRHGYGQNQQTADTVPRPRTSPTLNK